VRKALALSVVLGLSLGGCTWLLGHGDVPQPRSPVQVAEAQQTAVVDGLRLEARLLGVGERIVTARNAFGRVGRVVNPYGEDVFVFQVRAVNAGADPVVLLPHQATLSVGTGDPVNALTLDAYRRRWPAWPVTNDQQGEDQSAAYAHVLQTLLLERQVPAGEATEGRLAFPVRPAREALTLKLPVRFMRETRLLTLRWAL
jgi:hypothetical protein